MYTYVGLSALLVSTSRAMRRPQHVERVTELAPRSFCIWLIYIINVFMVAKDKKYLYEKKNFCNLFSDFIHGLAFWWVDRVD